MTKRAGRKVKRGNTADKGGKRVREIQEVFERLGLPDDAARRQIRQGCGAPPARPALYRVVLAGTTPLP